MAPEGLWGGQKESERTVLEIARELGCRGMVEVKFPCRSESVDVIDFDLEIAQREAAGLQPGVNFWTGDLPAEVDN